MKETFEKITPAMKQFHQFKKQYPDAVLFFRMGDFYETFYEDAQICAKVLGLTLTSRSKGDNPIPLAGVPFHAVDGYIKKMIDAGYRVAVCEQVEDPKQAKGVVKRDVLRIITPGTLTDDMLLDEKDDNFLCAFNPVSAKPAISWIDVSTGHFFALEVNGDNITDEILRLSPRECLVPQLKGNLFQAQATKAINILKQSNIIITERPGWYFEPPLAYKTLLGHFKTNTLQGFGIENNDGIISPSGAIIEYLNETQKTALNHISVLKKINRTTYLQLDQTTLKSLEVLYTIRSQSRKGSLIDSIDCTMTPQGGRMLKSWVCLPLCDVQQINQRQQAVEELINNSAQLGQFRAALKNICDLERVAARISTKRTNPRDLLSLACTLKNLPQIQQNLSGFGNSILRDLFSSCDLMQSAADMLEAAIDENAPTHLRQGGVINNGFNEQLDHLRAINKDGKQWLQKYQQEQIAKTGIDKLKIGYNKVFGYYIELSRQYSDKVPAEYIRKQTVKNAERYITEQLKEYEEQVLTAFDKAVMLENEIFEQILLECGKYINNLQGLASAVAVLDCLCCFAYLASQRGYVRPIVDNSKIIKINDGKHPVLSESLKNEFVPNDVDLDDKKEVALITGPNMAGKSTYIRQTALLVLLSHTGCYIPASEANIGLTDRIFTRVGASDEILAGQSTFMVEMTETANIVNNATDRSLVILDEIGRGTSTYDGLALAWAITEHLAKKIKCRTLFATHYHQLIQLSQLFENVKNYNVAVREWMDEIVFLHKIIQGGTDKSYGIYVAKLAGLPNDVISRSKEILNDLEQTFAKEASSEHFTKTATKKDDTDSLFVYKNKSILDKLSSIDINNLTPLEAINLLNQIKKEIQN